MKTSQRNKIRAIATAKGQQLRLPGMGNTELFLYKQCTYTETDLKN